MSYLKILLRRVKDWWYMRKEVLALNDAKRKADFMHETHNGAKYIVLKNPYGDFIAMSKADFQYMKVRGMFDKRTTWRTAVENSYYSTQ